MSWLLKYSLVFFVFVFICNLNAYANDFETSETNVELYELLDELIQYQGNQTDAPSVKPVHMLIHAIDEFKFAEASTVLEELIADPELIAIYQNAILLLSLPVGEPDQTHYNYFVQCAENLEPKFAYHCARIIALNGIKTRGDSVELQNWATRAVELAAVIPKVDPDYWSAQFFSRDILRTALISSKNLPELINTTSLAIEAAERSDDALQVVNIVFGLAAISNLDYGPEEALNILNKYRGQVKFDDDFEEQQILFLQGRYLTDLERFDDAAEVFESLTEMQLMPNFQQASLPMRALVAFKTNNIDRAEDLLPQAEKYYAGNDSSVYTPYLYRAQIENFKEIGNHEAAFETHERLQKHLQQKYQKDRSAERNQLFAKIQNTGERLKREKDALAFEAQITEAQIKQDRVTRAGILLALAFAMGFGVYYFRSNARTSRLNTELETANNELETSHTELTTMHADLKVAHKAALAGKEAKERFIGVVGHELRTPLNPIINLTAIVKDKVTDPTQKNFLSEIYKASVRLHMIVENMLAISHQITDVYYEPVNMRNLIKDVMSDHGETYLARVKAARLAGKTLKVNAQVSKNFPDDFSTAKILLKRVMTNIIDNALKFTNDGVITISANYDDAAGRASLQISDTGLGISPEIIPEMYEPYKQGDMSLTRKHEGAGLGLAVAKHYIERIGGTIKIETRLNHGTTVFIELEQRENSMDRRLKAA